VSIEKAIAPTPATELGSVPNCASTYDDPLPIDAVSRVKIPKLNIQLFDGDKPSGHAFGTL